MDQLRLDLLSIPPWVLPDAKVDLTLLGKNNNKSTQKYIDSYHIYIQISTDASRNSAGRFVLAFSVKEIGQETQEY